MKTLLEHSTEAIAIMLVAAAIGLFSWWFITPTPCHQWADGGFRSIPDGVNGKERFDYRAALYERCRAERAGEPTEQETP